MKPDFMDRAAKIIAEVRDRICIDKIDIEVIKEILQDELEEYSYALHECYDDGYEDGYAACQSSLEADADSAFVDGYALGYEDGRSKCINS